MGGVGEERQRGEGGWGGRCPTPRNLSSVALFPPRTVAAAEHKDAVVAQTDGTPQRAAGPLPPSRLPIHPDPPASSLHRGRPHVPPPWTPTHRRARHRPPPAQPPRLGPPQLLPPCPLGPRCRGIPHKAPSPPFPHPPPVPTKVVQLGMTAFQQPLPPRAAATTPSPRAGQRCRRRPMPDRSGVEAPRPRRRRARGVRRRGSSPW